MTTKTKRVIIVIFSIALISFVLLLTLAYIRHRDLKNALVAQLSAQATSFIGQEVTAEDLSISPAGAIEIHNIRVHNPSGFEPGKLLVIKKLSLKANYKDILRKRLFFDKIAVHAPELTLLRNKEGKLNISDKLREFFTRKSTREYRIDEFVISSGTIDFKGDWKYRNDNVNLVLKNLSSEYDTQTLISGHTTFAYSNVSVEGWVYLKNEPKRLNVSLSSQDVSLSALRESLNRYGVQLTKTKGTFFLNADGDTEKGVRLTSEIAIKDAKFAFIKGDMDKMVFKLQAFFHIPEKTLTIDTASLNAGGLTTITGKGTLAQEHEDFLYTAEIAIRGLDLSVMNFFKDLKMSGIISSQNLLVRGNLRNPLPEVSGDIHLKDGAFQTSKVSIGRVNADMKFTSDTKAAFGISLKDFRYGGYSIPWLQAKSDVAYRDDTITLNAPEVTSPDFAVSSRRAAVRWSARDNVDVITANVNGINASYPLKGIGTTNADISVTLNKKRKVWDGNFDFSTGEVTFQSMRGALLKGKGHFDEKKYSLDIAQADIAGGRIRLAAEGGMSGKIFPLKIKGNAENVSIESLSKNMSDILSISYPQSGRIKKASFDATIESSGAVKGMADFDADGITILATNTKRTIIQNGILHTGISFKGQDLEFIGDAKSGTVTARISGSANEFLNRDRLIMVHLSFPEVKAQDVRETFWDIFPDSLLYAGLDGSLALDITVRYDASGLSLNGKFLLSDLVLSGENGEYSIGPINGVVPVAYMPVSANQNLWEVPSFEREEFQKLKKQFAQKTMDARYNLITVGQVSYGFPMIDNGKIWIRSEGKSLHIGHVSGNIFGGTLNGSAVVDFSDRFRYRAGFLIDGFSLAQLCDRIEPIRGYISGKVDGIATLKGDGSGLSRLIGKADFWSYSSPKENTKISREFLQKIGGPSLKWYLGDRSFDKGIMSFYLQGGYIIFRELEISNRNFIGMKDLDIKVAPLNNRIAIDHLMWSITEAAYRAKKKE